MSVQPDQLAFSLWRSIRRWRTAAIGLGLLNLLLIGAAIPAALQLRAMDTRAAAVDQQLADVGRRVTAAQSAASAAQRVGTADAATVATALDELRGDVRDLQHTVAELEDLPTPPAIQAPRESFANQQQLREFDARLSDLQRVVTEMKRASEQSAGGGRGAKLDADAIAKVVQVVMADALADERQSADHKFADVDRRLHNLQKQVAVVATALDNLTRRSR